MEWEFRKMKLKHLKDISRKLKMQTKKLEVEVFIISQRRKDKVMRVKNQTYRFS